MLPQHGDFARIMARKVEMMLNRKTVIVTDLDAPSQRAKVHSFNCRAGEARYDARVVP